MSSNPPDETDIAPSSRVTSDARDLDALSRPHKRGCLPDLPTVICYLKADLYRYHGDGRLKFWRHFLFTPGYKYTVWMRLAGWASNSKLTLFTFGWFLKWMLMRCRYKYGIAIPEYTEIGPGLFINRFGAIYMNGDAVIGANVNIAQMTLIGQANRGKRAGSPTVGDRVYVGVGTCIVGRITVGNGVVVGVNSVVSRDIPEDAVVAGTPAEILSMQGSTGYINRMVPDAMIRTCYQLRDRGRRTGHRSASPDMSGK